MNSKEEISVLKKIFRDQILQTSCWMLLTCMVIFAGHEAFAAEENSQPAEITVSASGTFRLVPDMASVSFSLTTQEKTAEQAQKKNSDEVQKVLKVLKDQGIDEKNISTSNYRMDAQYEYSDNGNAKIVGYNVCTSMMVNNQKIENMGKIMSDCVAAGVNSIDNVVFMCSEYDAMYQQALQQAVEASKTKAEKLVMAAGKNLGDIVAIVEGDQTSSSQYLQTENISYAVEAAADTIGPALCPGELEVRANVTVIFQMK